MPVWEVDGGLYLANGALETTEEFQNGLKYSIIRGQILIIYRRVVSAGPEEPRVTFWILVTAADVSKYAIP